MCDGHLHSPVEAAPAGRIQEFLRVSIEIARYAQKFRSFRTASLRGTCYTANQFGAAGCSEGAEAMRSISSKMDRSRSPSPLKTGPRSVATVEDPVHSGDFGLPLARGTGLAHALMDVRA